MTAQILFRKPRDIFINGFFVSRNSFQILEKKFNVSNRNRYKRIEEMVFINLSFYAEHIQNFDHKNMNTEYCT